MSGRGRPVRNPISKRPRKAAGAAVYYRPPWRLARVAVRAGAHAIGGVLNNTPGGAPVGLHCVTLCVELTWRWNTRAEPMLVAAWQNLRMNFTARPGAAHHRQQRWKCSQAIIKVAVLPEIEVLLDLHGTTHG